MDLDSHSVSRRPTGHRRTPQNCECLHCSQYEAKFKPSVHPCPNFKTRMTGKKKARKAPKKVITSRWVHPPKFDSQRSFPPCRCLPPSVKVSREQSSSSEGTLSDITSLEREEAETFKRQEKEKNARKDFYDALEKQAVKTSGTKQKYPRKSKPTHKEVTPTHSPRSASPRTSSSESSADTLRISKSKRSGAKSPKPKRGERSLGIPTQHSTPAGVTKKKKRERKSDKPEDSSNKEVVPPHSSRSVSQETISSESSADTSKISNSKRSGAKSPKPKRDGRPLGTAAQHSTPPDATKKRKRDRKSAKPKEVLPKHMPRSISQELISSESSDDTSRISNSKRPRAKSPEAATGGGPLGTPTAHSTPVENTKQRKLERKSATPKDANLKVSSSVSFSQMQREESISKISKDSQSSSRSRGLLKDPRSTTVRSNSARLFLEEEQRRKLQEAMEKSLSPEVADEDLSKTKKQHQPGGFDRIAKPGTSNSSVSSEEPVPKSRLAPSRQFMNIVAQESAKRKLIARAKAAQEPDSTNLFGMENHYEVFSIEKMVNGSLWGVRAYRPI